MLERRNLILAGLAAVPVGATGLLASTSKSDAAVLAQADRVKRLQAEKTATSARLGTLEEEHERRRGERPERLSVAEITRACTCLLGRFPEITPEADEALSALRERTEAAQKARFEAWNDKSTHIAEELGLPAAGEVYDDAYDRLCDGVEDLAKMRATSLRGLVAKATAFAALDPRTDNNDMFPVHQEELMLSLVRDLVALASDKVA